MRGIIGMALVLAFVFNSASPSSASTVGVIAGTVKSFTTGAPIADVAVTATSPSGRYTATTDKAGFYSMTGVSADTYIISFRVAHYDIATVTGVTVFADQTQTVNAALRPTLQVIGRTTARSPGGAYQPTQTVDTYNVTQTQIQTALGKPGGTNEVALLASLPGASLDSSGYPVLRGGRENEEGYQFEGIDYTDAFTSQFINALALPANGIAQLQLTPGAGDASIGNSGTGVINLVSKRGSYPAFGSAEVDTRVAPFAHQLNFEYGFGTPNGRWSDYLNFTGGGTGNRYGGPGTIPAAQIGTFFSRTYSMSRDIVNNLVYKFGHNNNQSLQLFYDNSLFLLYQNAGGISNGPFDASRFYGLPAGSVFFPTLCYKTCDPLELTQIQALAPGVTIPQIMSIMPLWPGQRSALQQLDRRSAYHEGGETLKLQYANNINASTYFTVRYYQVNSVTTFDWPYISNSPFANSFVLQQGGLRHGVAFDTVKQLSSKHLMQFGGKYDYLHPVYDQPDNVYGILQGLPFLGSAGSEIYDFLPGGYLTAGGFIPQGTRMPLSIEQSISNRQDWALYLQDTWSPNSRLKVNLGVRLDAANYRLPAAKVDPKTCTFLYLPDQLTFTPNVAATDPCPTLTFNNATSKDKIQPRIWEPRFNVSYQMGQNDALRFSYGRSVNFPPLGQVDLNGALSAAYYGMYQAVPANPAAGPICGVLGNQYCPSYAEQLRWENQNFVFGVPMQPVKPETFNNFDISYSHQFPHNLAFKITPFYRRGYDATALVATQRIGPGGVPVIDPNGLPVLNPPVATNLGLEKTTGVELLITKEAPYGLSGQFSATYINELSSVIPLSGSEDFFPSIPPESVQLGNIYRVGFLSPFQATLAVQYKTHSGWRFNPVVSFDVGYPIGSGLITSASINGRAFNVPNTNVSIQGAIGGSANAPAYVDPQNPGTLFNPNIAARRGTPEANNPGGKLSGPESRTNLGIDYTPPEHPRNTFGVLIGNIFGQLHSGAVLNSRYQPVATGISGPLTGLSSSAFLYPQTGSANFGPVRRGQEAYLDTPSGAGTTFLFYYQLKL